jgi:S-DNA-T family DNA segregation ATPase FtsK/SpoIIIE
VLFLACFITLLSFINLAGPLGEFVKNILARIFGWPMYIIPLILGVLGYIILKPERFEMRVSRWIGLVLFVITLCGLFHVFFPLDKALDIIEQGKGGGYLGFIISFPFQKIMGKWATLILILALFFVSILVMFNTSIKALIRGTKGVLEPGKEILKKVSEKFPKKEKEEITINEMESLEPENQKPELDLEMRGLKEKAEVEKVSRISKSWKPYPLTLLDVKGDRPTSGDIKTNLRRIQETLRNFGIEVEMGEVSVGPTVTQYTLRPKEGIKLSQITALHNDLALALAAHPIRIEAPIPGKSLVGIEVPNQAVAKVRLREILESQAFLKRRSNLALALGKNVAGTPILAHLDKMPHLLVAGATGSGKTICIHSIILTLLYQNSPEDLKLILVDPKRVELTAYNGLPHLLTPVVQDIDKTINALRWAVTEMDRRFKLFAKTQARDIITYNRKTEERLPYLVIAVDELADLMVVAPREVEGCVVRLAQMARATGIHLILSTQRPSVNVITGLIKANITSRIALACASSIDSRTIIDSSGAEKLLGNGDMLYVSSDISQPRRIQGAFVSDTEIEKVVSYLKEKIGEPEYNQEVLEKQKENGFTPEGIKNDELFEEAKKVVIQAGKGSASLLQRRLSVGYARAARLLDLLEEKGVVGPADGSKPRDVLVESIENKENTEEKENKEDIGY